jgi:hypothetical protein
LAIIEMNALPNWCSKGSIKVYPSGTTVPVPKGDESPASLQPFYKILPEDSSGEMPLIVVAPTPPQQGESPDLSFMIRAIRGLENRVSAISPTHKNPWMLVYQAMKAKTPRKIDTRCKAIKHYNGGNTAKGQRRGFGAECCVTGCHGFDREVDAAHILPHGSPEYWLNNFGIQDLDNLRNVVLLCKNIETAFDKLQLCFLQVNEKPGTYKLKVWDKEGLEGTILYTPRNRNRIDGSVTLEDGTESVADDKSSKLITTYDGHEFCFPEGKHPFSKLLSYHAQESYKMALDKKWIPLSEECPKKYGSPFDDIIITCHNSFEPLQRGDTSITSETSLSARQLSFRGSSVEHDLQEMHSQFSLQMQQEQQEKANMAQQMAQMQEQMAKMQAHFNNNNCSLS